MRWSKTANTFTYLSINHFSQIVATFSILCCCWISESCRVGYGFKFLITLSEPQSHGLISSGVDKHKSAHVCYWFMLPRGTQEGFFEKGKSERTTQSAKEHRRRTAGRWRYFTRKIALAAHAIAFLLNIALSKADFTQKSCKMHEKRILAWTQLEF